MNELDAFLLNILTAMHDPQSALMGDPLTPDDALLADRMLNVLGRTYFTESEIDDLLEFAYEISPITMTAARSARWTATNSTLITVHCATHGSHDAVADYCLN